MQMWVNRNLFEVVGGQWLQKTVLSININIGLPLVIQFTPCSHVNDHN